MRLPLLVTLVVLALALWATKTSADDAPRDPRLAAVHDWAFAISTDVDSDALVTRLAPYDLVVVDGELTAAARVTQMRASGSLVLGYLSVGTIEAFRPWYRKAKPYRMELWGAWGEWYADVRDPGFRRLVGGRVARRILRKGFDGLFLDNVDMIDGHPRQRRSMFRLVRRLAHLVHSRGGLLFAQNGAKAIKPVWDVLDGWNREDVTGTYDFERRRYLRQKPADVSAATSELRRLSSLGLLVTATDYTRAGDQEAMTASVANACAAGALPYVSDISLRRLPSAPFACAP